jgi:hypothetical protein
MNLQEHRIAFKSLSLGGFHRYGAARPDERVDRVGSGL